MSVTVARLEPDIRRRVLRLQAATVIWMSAEAAIALAAAAAARSPALFGFGGDSAVELLSAVVVLWRFRSKSDAAQAERIAARVAGGLLLALAVSVAAASALPLLGGGEPRPSVAGIVLLVVAALGMPWLAKRKRKLAAQTGSASLRADAAESAFCGYMSWIALAGLLTNALAHRSWADPLAALALIPFMVKEGWHVLHASQPDCC